jgi:hypothetical protein
VLGSGWLLGAMVWSLQVAAQTDVTPPPADPPPAAPVEPPAPPPTPPAETPPPAPPSEAPPTAPPPTAAPPSTTPPPAGAFPLPPAEKKPSPKQTASHAPAVQPGPAPAPAAETSSPQRHTEGLFDEKQPSEVRHHESEADAEDDKVDQFKIGPVVGTGIPALISVGGTVKLTRFLGAGVNLGLIPKVQLSYYGNATLSYKHLDFYGRIYPFGGGVFLHGGVGYATVDGTLSKTVTDSRLPGGAVSYDSDGSVKTLMLTALLGYFHTFDIGFSIGVDAGAQFPIAPSKVEFESRLGGVSKPLEDAVRAQYLDPIDRDVRDTLETIGRTTIPTINFRIGWIL